MNINTNKQTGAYLENQIELLCEKPNFQRVIATTSLNADTFALVRNSTAHLCKSKEQEQKEQTGITACYERLSRDDEQQGESNSIATQKRILESYCESSGYKAVEHYEDDGYTGTNFQRPGFQRMLADIKAGKIARVIVKDMSRFGRDYLQVGMYTDVVFPEFGVHFIAVNDGVDSRRGDNEFTAIRNVFNEMYARDTSKKCKAAWQSKGKAGEKLNVIPPYGYLKDPNDKKTWLVDEEAAAVVQKIFALCVEGRGPAQIAKHLKERRILNPSSHHRKQGTPTNGRHMKDPYKWDSTVVSSILERLEYLGHTVNFKTYKQSYKSSKMLRNDPDKWAIFENAHEPIIEESVFEIVQNLRKTRRRPTRQGEMGLFSGLLFCEDCNGKLYLNRANTAKSKVEYYTCSTNRNNRELCDSPHTIRNVILKEIVLQNIRQAVAYVSRHESDFIREFAEMSAKAHDKGLLADKQALAKAEKRIDELDGIIKRLYEDNLSGKLTDERFMKFSRDYENEQEKLKTSIEAMRHDVKQREQKKSNTNHFISAAKKFTDLKELDGSIIREFVDRIEVSAKEKGSKLRRINIVYNFIGAFDFNTAWESAEVGQLQRKTA
jgi:DNA invertase Pin-like site-specific DNA recombinase